MLTSHPVTHHGEKRAWKNAGKRRRRRGRRGVGEGGRRKMVNE
jgi:hypothetical protein